MSFFYLLKENKFDWEKTKEIFYNLTEPQVIFINEASYVHAMMQKDAEEKAQKEATRQSRMGAGETHKKSFNLRG